MILMPLTLEGIVFIKPLRFFRDYLPFTCKEEEMTLSSCCLLYCFPMPHLRKCCTKSYTNAFLHQHRWLLFIVQSLGRILSPSVYFPGDENITL